MAGMESPPRVDGDIVGHALGREALIGPASMLGKTWKDVDGAVAGCSRRRSRGITSHRRTKRRMVESCSA